MAMQTQNGIWRVGKVLEVVREVDPDASVISSDLDGGTRRTGFCFSTLPGTAVLAASAKWFRLAESSESVSCIITPASVAKVVKLDQRPYVKPVIVCRRADEAFYHLHNQAIHQSESPGPTRQHIDATARVDESSVIRGDVRIAANVMVGPHCTIIGPAEIGEGVVMDARVVVGAEGLFTKRVAGKLVHVRHYGGVTIGANCHLHAGATIVRAVNHQESTVVGDCVSVGINAVVGHDVIIGDETVISTGAELLGRARVGQQCWIGAAAVISNSVVVGDEASVRVGAVAIKDVPDKGDVSGNFAESHRLRLRKLAAERSN